MRIALVYFSATGNTSQIARVINDHFVAIGAKVDNYDITSHVARERAIDFRGYDACVFGAPIHSWRAPRVVREWIQTILGDGRKCAMFFTYGGFGVHPAHYSMRKILTDRNFIVVSSAEFLGWHTFNLGGWQAMVGRPDDSDFAVARKFVEGTYKRFRGEDKGILGELEKTVYTDEELDQIETLRFRILTKLPSRDGADCSMCMLCEELCPTGAMDAMRDHVDKGKCIACLRCVASCPECALQINDTSETWSVKLAMERVTEEDLQGKQSKLYF